MARRRDDKGRSKRRDFKKVDESDDSDSAINDAASAASGTSNVEPNYAHDEMDRRQTSDIDDDDYDNEQGDSRQEIDDFEMKLEQMIDHLQTAKAAKSRAMHYESLSKALTTRFCYDYLESRKMTIQDIIEHGLKHSDDEAGFAATILSLTLITMGASDDSDALFRDLFATLDRLMMDTTAKPAVRSKCAIALSLGCFITDYGIEKTNHLLGELLAVGFTTVKGHPDAAQLASIHAMKATCIDMFSFLATIESDEYAAVALEENIVPLVAALDSPCLSLRVAAGECIASMAEKSLEWDADYVLPLRETICDKIHGLATDSQKSRSKKELRVQRSNFRQILRAIEELDNYSSARAYGNGDDAAYGIFGEPEHIRISPHERVTIDCWRTKLYYDTFCAVLASGMNLHLSQNMLLRDIFDLGVVLIDQGRVPTKASKLEKNFINNFNRKHREINRGKQRGKRSDFDI